MKARELIFIIAENIADGWKPKSKGNEFWLEREVEEGVELVYFNSIKTFNGFRLGGVLTCAKAFREIEDILIPLYNKYNLGFLHQTIYSMTQQDDQCFEIDITSIEKVEMILPWIKSKLKNEIYPFLEKYKSINQVNEKVNSLKREEISYFVYVPPVIKLFTLKGLLKTDDFEEFANWAIEVYEKMSMGKENGNEMKSLLILRDLKGYFQKS